jgi:hypothetical protein
MADIKTIILGCTPPALAIAAELFNPVTGKAIENEAKDRAGQFFSPGTGDTNSLARFAAETADAAIEVTSIIPTWISVTAAASAVLVDRVNGTGLAVGLAVWAAICGIMAPRLFELFPYSTMSSQWTRLPWLRGRVTQSKCISYALVFANVLAILAVVVSELAFPLTPHSRG